MRERSHARVQLRRIFAECIHAKIHRIFGVLKIFDFHDFVSEANRINFKTKLVCQKQPRTKVRGVFLSMPKIPIAYSALKR